MEQLLNGALGTPESGPPRNPCGVGDVVRENNFGVMNADWAARGLNLLLRRADGQLATSTTVPFDEIGALVA